MREQGFDGPVWRIPHAGLAGARTSAPARIEGAALIGCFGHLNPAKRIPQLLEPSRGSARASPDAGSCSPGRRAGLRARPAARGDSASRTQSSATATWTSERLWALMAACDVLVSLRSPTMGETSAACVCGRSSLGKPLVVSDLGWFAELPGRGRPARPGRWAGDRGAGRRPGGAGGRRGRAPRAGRSRATSTCGPTTTSSAWPSCTSAALEWAVGGEAVSVAVVREIAQAAADVEIGADSPELAVIARELRESEIV